MSNETNKTSIKPIKDIRSPKMKDVPYSAYCKTCWQPMFGFLMEVHDGSCSQVKDGETQCENAKAWQDNMVALNKSMEDENVR